MRIETGYELRRARVELLPMIDVVFLLLVFFIYAMLSMVQHRGIRVALPGGATAELNKHQFVSVTISADNAIAVDGKPAELDGVADMVLAGRRDAGDAPVFIGGDKHADLGLALRVLDRLRQAGIGEVTFEMQREKP